MIKNIFHVRRHICRLEKYLDIYLNEHELVQVRTFHKVSRNFLNERIMKKKILLGAEIDPILFFYATVITM